MSLEALEGFIVFLEETGRGQQESTVSSKTVPEDLNMKFRSKFYHGFTNRGCLHYAIIKTLYCFKEKREHEARDTQFFLQNVQNKIFKILKMFK